MIDFEEKEARLAKEEAQLNKEYLEHKDNICL